MNFPISVYVSDGMVSYTLELDKRVTIISGDSGVGKSTLCRLIIDKDRDKGYTEKVSEEMYSLATIPQGNWEDVYYGYLLNSKIKDKRYIFVLDDVDYIMSDKFIELLKIDNHNLYIIINRLHKLKGTAPYSDLCNIGSVYSMASDGYRHWLRRRG